MLISSSMLIRSGMLVPVLKQWITKQDAALSNLLGTGVLGFFENIVDFFESDTNTTCFSSSTIPGDTHLQLYNHWHCKHYVYIRNYI